MKRGAFFFVLDAFIAGIIIISSLVLVFSTLTINENPTQNYVLAEDFMIFLETTTINDYGGAIAYTLKVNGDIADPSVTLLEQVVLFYQDGTREDNITALLAEISLLAPANSGIGYYITNSSGNTTLLYNRTVIEPDDARLQLSAQRITMVRGQTLDPYIFEVRIWR